MTEELKQETIDVKEDTPTEIPAIALRGIVVFPLMETHVDIGRTSSMEAIDNALGQDKRLIVLVQKDGKIEEPTPEDLYEYGTLVEIKRVIKLPTDGLRMLVKGIECIKVNEFVTKEPFFVVQYESCQLTNDCQGEELEALLRSVMQGFESYSKKIGKITPDNFKRIIETEDIEKRLDLMASFLSITLEEKMQLLSADSLQQKLETMLGILIKEARLSELEMRINEQVKRQMDKSQKEYYLREKIKVISDELGEGEDRAAEIGEFKERIEQSKMSDDVKEKALKEVNRLAKITSMSPEYAVIRNYLDWLLDLPWNVYTEDQMDIKIAEEVLETDHYGLEKVKERILEFLAVRQLKNDTKGSIICLVGPPGVGKTSLAKSIAKALNKNFVRLSLGGVRDEAEIRGHRRTYVGALPGRIIRGLTEAKSANPVFLFDEVDKMTNDFRGDPASALLEVLDPEQNSTFSDHFIEIPFDLSKVMFITTANSAHTIPEPLLDRMELIELSSYTEEEKVQIAIRYLVPKQIIEQGLKEEQLFISANTILDIVRYYTREAGVRNLERQISAICRKAAREIVSGKKSSIRVTKQNLEKFLGKPRYHYGITEENDEVGVVTGMAWTSVGGEILQIEANVLSGKGNLMLTGQLGDVMKESAQMGLSFIRSISDQLDLEEDFYEKCDIHIHVPEGAVPKDGPSAGVTMVTAMISALTGRKVRKEVAMTGEMTLRGKVLPIGGVKEKVLAAHRASSKIIILPKENQKDIEDIPLNIQKELTFHFVSTIDEVLDLALIKEKKNRRKTNK